MLPGGSSSARSSSQSWGTSFECCADVSFSCQAVRMVSVELPSIKNAMLRKKKASEFIGANRTEALGGVDLETPVGVQVGPLRRRAAGGSLGRR